MSEKVNTQNNHQTHSFLLLQNHIIPIQILKQGKTKNLQRPSDHLHTNHKGDVFSLLQRNYYSLKRLLQKCAFPQRFSLQGE